MLPPWFILFFVKVRASCSLFNVDCQTAGALISLDSTCYASRNMTDENFISNMTGLYLLKTVENSTISSDCPLANQQVLEYSNCFSANTDTDASLNYTAQVVKTVNLNGTEISVGLLEEIFCKPAIEIKNEKEALLISTATTNGAIDPVVEIQLSGDELSHYPAVIKQKNKAVKSSALS